MQHLKIALIQSDLVWENPIQNRLNFSEKIDSIEEQVDLIVLPEMFATGFSMSPSNIAESMDGETVNWMVEIAADKKCAIGGSLIIKEDGKYFNRFVFVHPSGEIETYNKRHLFTLAGEEKVYTQGEHKLIVDYKGWKIYPLICYDLRFPVWARNVENYDVVLYVANWPKKRVAAWDALLKARSIENMSYVVGVNRVGVDANNFEYSGHSTAFDCLGVELVKTEPNKESITIITLDKEHLNDTRKRLNFLNDKDSFQISL